MPTSQQATSGPSLFEKCKWRGRQAAPRSQLSQRGMCVRIDSGHVIGMMDASAKYISKALPCMLGNPRIRQSINQWISTWGLNYQPGLWIPAVCWGFPQSTTVQFSILLQNERKLLTEQLKSSHWFGVILGQFWASLTNQVSKVTKYFPVALSTLRGSSL